MKKIFIILLITLFTSQVSQAKEKVDKDAKIDSLTKANKELSSTLDSVTKDLVKYKEVYTVLKDRVVKQDFDPTRISIMIDSAYTLEKATMASYAVVKDSLAFYKDENMQLKSSMNGIVEPQSANNRLIYELKQLKELLDSKILTQAEFDIRKAAILQRWK
jgi:hypothetical protein